MPSLTQIRLARRCRVVDPAGATVDDAVATLYAAPHSYTGEDMLELTVHGGAVAPILVLDTLVAAGARQAEPGEFTRRAVLNGKLDLLQAEAVADVIDARSSAAHRQALRQLGGGLSRQLTDLRGQILQLEALLAYDIDFPEEDDGPISRERVAAATDEVMTTLQRLLSTGRIGELVHDGALVVLAGPPNVGKSSLFNALVGESRAIVTETPGTTRDAIEAVIDRPTFPLRLVDTAGLRQDPDPIERLGIETATRYLERAAIVLACLTGVADECVTATLRDCTDAAIITVGTKADLARAAFDADVHVSALTGTGLSELLALIEARLGERPGLSAPDAPVLTRTRHRVMIEQAVEEMHRFRAAWAVSDLPAPVVASHLHAARGSLEELIGTVQVDDVLDVVFRSFCVGK